MIVQIRDMKKSDWDKVRFIYQQGIDTNIATFEADCPDYGIFNTSHIDSCRFVISENDIVIGWAALSPVSNHCVYGGVAEVSIYIDENHQGKGIGAQLLNHIMGKSELQGFWTLQSSIMQDNPASIRLHEKCGFRMVGYQEKIGKDRYGNWRNTVLMERRSKQPQFNKRRDFTMKTISIYEPAMCCETGICGVSVDPELLRISTLFNNLKKNGITAARFNLNSTPQAFINNAEINKLINYEGVDALPATVIDGNIVKTKAYPTNEEIAAWLEISANYLSEASKDTDGGCCCKGGCC